MPRLLRRNALHRDFTTQPETAIPRTTTKGGSLIRCTSIPNGYSLNSIVFQASTGVRQAELIASSTQKLHQADLENDVQIPRVGAQTREPSSPWTYHHRVNSMLSPKGSSGPHGFLLIMLPNAGNRRTKPKICAQARIEKP